VNGKPYQSCLAPYEDEIIALRRRKLPMSYAKIAQYLHEKHQTYNLTRLPPEVAAARNKIIEEKMRAKYYPNRQPKEKL